MGADPLLQLVRLVLTTQDTEVGDEVAGRVQGVGVVLTQYLAEAGEGVLVEVAGLLVLAQLVQVLGEIADDLSITCMRGWPCMATA
jgi:hypothetical protein